MESELLITFKDILLFILWIMVVGVLAYIIFILSKAHKIVKSIHHIVADNKSHIDQTIEVVPQLAKNADTISEEIAHDVASFRGTVDNVSKTAESVTGKLSENANLVSGIGSIVHTASIGKALYDKYFANKYRNTIDDVKEAINDVNQTLRDLEEK